VAHARGDLGGVRLDLHPAAAPVAELAAGHVAIDRVAVELEPGR